nr:hypothetical protein [Tanacetum cinerariifolium]
LELILLKTSKIYAKGLLLLMKDLLLLNPPYKYEWTEKTVPVTEGSSETTTEGYRENYKNVLQDIRDQLNAEAESVQIIITGIYNLSTPQLLLVLIHVKCGKPIKEQADWKDDTDDEPGDQELEAHYMYMA